MIKLVDFTPDFAMYVLQWHKDPSVADAAGLWETFYDESDLWRQLADMACDARTVVFGIVDGETPVGYIMLKNIDMRTKSAEMHITIGNADYFGTGAGPRAYRKMIDYGFSALQLNRIYTFVFDFRPDLIAMMDRNKIGFKREGQLRQAIQRDGQYHDVIVYGLLKEDYVKGEQSCRQ